MDNRKRKWLPWVLIIIIIGLGLSLYLYFQQRDDITENAAPENGAVQYTCPMHPTIVQDHPGDCPICGMKLVKMEPEKSKSVSSNEPRKILFYRSPMDPNVTSHEPRKDEMGMDYIPVYEEGAGGGDVQGRTAVTIDPKRQQLIGLRTATATRGKVGGGWFTVGRVESDPTRVSKINVKVSGYVEHVFVDFAGKPVQRGEKLFTFYSPDLYAAQQEYLLARKGRDTLAEDDILISAVRQKLRLWDVTDAQIKRLEETGEATRTLTIVSPVTGIITAKNVVDGSSLNAGDVAYEVTDLSTVWVMAAAYQPDLSRVNVGMSASMSFESLPEKVFRGTVAFIDPVLDPATRSANVRLTMENKDGQLKPGMFGEVLFRDAAHEALTIPADAIIPSGRGNYVFIAIGNGEFEPREVFIGEKSGDMVEVTRGLTDGELVVTRANFLVDSESSLRAALASVKGS